MAEALEFIIYNFNLFCLLYSKYVYLWCTILKDVNANLSFLTNLYLDNCFLLIQFTQTKKLYFNLTSLIVYAKISVHFGSNDFLSRLISKPRF